MEIKMETCLLCKNQVPPLEASDNEFDSEEETSADREEWKKSEEEWNRKVEEQKALLVTGWSHKGQDLSLMDPSRDIHFTDPFTEQMKRSAEWYVAPRERP